VYLKRALPQQAVYFAQVPGSSTDKNYTSTHAALSVASHAKTRVHSALQDTCEETNGDDDTATPHPLVRCDNSRVADGGALRAGQAATCLIQMSDQAFQKEDIQLKAFRSDKAPKVED
jgi:hypothetical protein